MLHPFPFNPAYGYVLQTLLQVTAPPDPPGFEAFWRGTFTEAQKIPTRLTRRPLPSPNPDLDAFEVEFDSWGDVRIGGWMTIPKNQPITRGLVVGHGYGARTEPDWNLPGPPAAAIFPCARGLGRSQRPDLPNEAQGHVLVGIDSPQTYIHRGCCCDYWAATTALLELFPHAADCLDYMGGSFGGGIGALMLPWDHRFRRAFLDVPSFGNHPLRLTLECTGSGRAVRDYYLQHSDVLHTLAFHDAATAARHIRIPTLVAAALFDPAVPPPGQFAVHNALGGPKDLFLRQTGHFDTPDKPAENQRLFERLERWFG
jgi:cephalosporin-C deacetylase